MSSMLVSSLGILMLFSAAAGYPTEQTSQLSFTGSGLTAEELSLEVSQQLGRPFVYVSSDPNARLSLNLKEISAPALLKILSKTGAVVLGSGGVTQGMDRKALLSTRFTVAATNARTAVLAEALERISVGRIKLVPRDSRAHLSVDLKDVDLGVLANALARVGIGDTWLEMARSSADNGNPAETAGRSRI
jgi:uncharacterized protein (DUF1786 family)